MGLYHYGSPEQLEARRALISLTRVGWGLQNPAFCRMFTNRFIPNASPVHENWFDDLQRMSTSAENAARLMDVDSGIDVRGLLREVRVPTLVIHCDRDHVVAPEQGRTLAAEIPHSRYVSLPSTNHLLLAEEPAWKMFATRNWAYSLGGTMLRKLGDEYNAHETALNFVYTRCGPAELLPSQLKQLWRTSKAIQKPSQDKPRVVDCDLRSGSRLA
jgi:hypothetical protein